MKKRILLRTIVFLILAGVLSSLGYLIYSKLQTRQTSEEKMSTLPAFVFYKTDGSKFTRADIPAGPLLLIHFQPSCENCQYEARELKEHAGELADVQVMMVSSAPAEEIMEFMDAYELSVYPNIIPLADKDRTFEATFGTSLIPLEIIYDSDHKLLKYFKGEVKIEAVIQQLKQAM